MQPSAAARSEKRLKGTGNIFDKYFKVILPTVAKVSAGAAIDRHITLTGVYKCTSTFYRLQ